MDLQLDRLNEERREDEHSSPIAMPTTQPWTSPWSRSSLTILLTKEFALKLCFVIRSEQIFAFCFMLLISLALLYSRERKKHSPELHIAS